jgi:hypothetical protein
MISIHLKKTNKTGRRRLGFAVNSKQNIIYYNGMA